MKILMTSDWHLKLGQKNVPVSWACDRYTKFFELVHKQEINHDLHIIGGDIFDRVPTLDELGLFFQYISNVLCPVIIYPGNHEATKKGQTFLSKLKDIVSRVSNKVEIVDEPRVYGDFTILPYNYLSNESIKKLQENKILFTHVRGEVPPHVKPEVNLDLFDKFAVVFAGDLHSHSNSQRNIVYPGSPMAITFHREPIKNGFITIDIERGDWVWEELIIRV